MAFPQTSSDTSKTARSGSFIIHYFCRHPCCRLFEAVDSPVRLSQKWIHPRDILGLIATWTSAIFFLVEQFGRY